MGESPSFASVKEKLTNLVVEGVPFPASVAPPSSPSKTLFLGGAGVRGIEIGGKFMAVTAIGVYLDEDTTVPAIAAKWMGKSAEELSNCVEFYQDIATGPFVKLTRVTMLLPLTGQQYSEKVVENCVAAWKAADVYTKDEAAAINHFLEIFRPKKFSPGASIFFTHSFRGSLNIGFSEDGALPINAAAVIENEKLSIAVLESIIGKNGVSPAAKESLAHRISLLLHKK